MLAATGLNLFGLNALRANPRLSGRHCKTALNLKSQMHCDKLPPPRIGSDTDQAAQPTLHCSANSAALHAYEVLEIVVADVSHGLKVKWKGGNIR